MAKIFDTHAHYDDRKFKEDRHELLSSLPENGIELVVNAGCDMKSSKISVELAEKYDFVYATVGFHPHAAKDMTDENIKELVMLASHPKVVAIGEIGLDYHYDFSPRDIQMKRFEEQMYMAMRLNMPAVVHDREAHADCLEVVKRFPVRRGVFHCYSGSPEMAEELLALNYYMSFGGAITFNGAKKALKTIEMMPLDRILLETDCPYLTPMPHRGKRNDSTYLPYVVEKIAEIRGMTPQEVIDVTTENGKRLFDIK